MVQQALEGMESLAKRETTMLSPMELLAIAVEKGADADSLGKLMDLQLRWQAEQARLAYENAMQTFKANPPDINKTKLVSFAVSGGRNTEYRHAELDKITEIIGGALKAVGIRHSWKTSDANGKITVTCVLTHEMGHSEDAATLSGPADSSGGKNNIQAIGSTVTYLQRYTLLAATGLAAKGTDDDGKTEGLPEDTITDYCIQMQDSSSFQELKPIFAECWDKAKKAGDDQAKARFEKVYNERKKDFANAGR